MVNTSQLLSVPYALHAKTADRVLGETHNAAILALTDIQILALTPYEGQVVYNRTLNRFMFYIDGAWAADKTILRSDCWSQPNQADAGERQVFTDNKTISTYLNANSPDPGCEGKWSVAVGEGGFFEDDTNPKTKFTGKLDDTYRLQWSIASSCGSSSSHIYVNFSFNIIEPDSDVRDIDGNTYKTIRYGKQVWMIENLKTTKYNDGTDIPHVTDNNEWNDLSTPAYCYYDNDDVLNKDTYGVLYNGFAVVTGKLCPEGWHIPSDEEWEELESYMSLNGFNFDGHIGNPEYPYIPKIAKAMASESGWESSSQEGAVGNTDYPEYRNKSGFTAFPVGGRSFSGGRFYNVGHYAYWWVATEFNLEGAYYRYLQRDNAYVYRLTYSKQNGFSVRCVRDK